MRREILIEGITPEIRIAVLEDDDLAELHVERSSGRGVSGNIYKGRVSNVLPGMQAAFVDIGIGRDAFLYVEDAGSRVDAERLEESDPGEEEPGVIPASGTPSPARIEDLLAPGQEIVVQVRKDAVADKGARLTSHLSLPGRFLVYLPGIPHIGVSRRIEDLAERERLKDAVRDLARDLGLPGGFIVRTAGEGRDASEFPADARYLAHAWEEIRRRTGSLATPALLHEEAGVVIKVLRDLLNRDVFQVVVDGEATGREAEEFVSRIEPDLMPRLRRHTGPRPLFEERGLQREIDRSLRPRVWLRSGGSIVINPTEALVAVDVNTGKFVGKNRLEETILRTNLEAATEIVRQIRLRDLGGIIVIDFIDMAEQASRDEVVRVLGAEMQKDRAKSRMLQISEFGLVEITRQRTRRNLERVLCRPCPACSGAGRLKSPETILWEILREIRALGPMGKGARVAARVHPDVAARLAEQGEGLLRGAVSSGPWPPLQFLPDPTLGHEEFALTVQDAS
jgi:ribonuclease G